MLALLFACKFDEHFVTLLPVCSGFPWGCYQFHSVAFFVHLSCTLNSPLVFLRQLQKAATSCQTFPGQALISLQPPLAFSLVYKEVSVSYTSSRFTRSWCSQLGAKGWKTGLLLSSFSKIHARCHSSPLWHQRRTVPGPRCKFPLMVLFFFREFSSWHPNGIPAERNTVTQLQGDGNQPMNLILTWLRSNTDKLLLMACTNFGFPKLFYCVLVLHSSSNL